MNNGLFSVSDVVRLVNTPYFPYRGGKARLRRYIVRWVVTKGSTYVEPFAGRANVFFLMRSFAQFKNWHLNDKQTIPFLMAIKGYMGETIPRVEKEDVAAFMKTQPVLGRVMEPLLYWAGGLSECANPTGYRGHDNVAYRKRVLEAASLLKGAKLTEWDALDVIRQYSKSKSAFLYVDPPYDASKLKEYSRESYNRKEMIELLVRAKCSWLLSEYECADLKKVFGEPVSVIKNVVLNPSPNMKGVRRVKECLWCNYSIEKPLTLDFGDSERPMLISKQILQRERKLTFDSWSSLAPRRWHKRTVKAQWDRLCCLPYTYFDGEEVWII